MLNMIGDRYGRLLVCEEAPRRGKYHRMLRCICDCGAKVTVSMDKLRTKSTVSCGCYQKEAAADAHRTPGRYFETEFKAWTGMIKRCETHKNYSHVTVCQQWLDSYDQFLSDVGPRPSDRHSLDRISPYLSYTPDNVRWATQDVQTRNTRIPPSNKLGVRGVSWSSEKNKYRAAIYVNNKQKHIGYFDDIEFAKNARRKAEIEFWGFNAPLPPGTVD